MITLTITIEEVEERKTALNIAGIGDGTNLEIDIAMQMRDSIVPLMAEMGAKITAEKCRVEISEPMPTTGQN